MEVNNVITPIWQDDSFKINSPVTVEALEAAEMIIKEN